MNTTPTKGKLLTRLEKQLETEFKKDAEECIKLYNYLKESTGYVWDSEWRPLVHTTIGVPPDGRKYKPSEIGKLVLEALEHRDRKRMKQNLIALLNA